MRMRVGLALLALLTMGAASAAPASAAACTHGATSWTNPAGGLWQDAASWDNGVPSKACAAKITLPGDYQVEMGAAGVARSVTIGGSSGSQILVSAAGEPLKVARSITVARTGAIKVVGGTVQTSRVLRIEGGRLYGGGDIRARGGLVNHGGLVGLAADAVITVNGSYAQDKAATIRVDVPSADVQSGPGRLRVSGPVALDGTLRINGPAPTRQAPFTVVQSSFGVIASFARIAFDDQRYAPIYDVTHVRVGPEPATPDNRAPVLSGFAARPASFKNSTTLGFSATEAGKVDVAIDWIGHREQIQTLVAPGIAGTNKYLLDARPYPDGLGLKPGRYRITLAAVDAAGNTSASITRVVTRKKTRSNP